MRFHIFFATDGSVSARFALAQILALPWRPPVHVTAMTAVEVPHPPFTSLIPAARRAYDTALSALREDAEANAAAVLDAARRALEGRVTSVATRAHRGYADVTIVDAASACRADLVSVGSRGLGPYKGILLGSVSNHVAQHAGSSVLVTKQPPTGRCRLLVALDGSDAEAGVVGWLKALDLSAGAFLHLVRVLRRLEKTSVDEFAAWANSPAALAAAGCASLPPERVRVTADTRYAHEVAEIEDAVHEFRPDLLVVGATAWSPARDEPLSKVSWKLVNQVPCSVVIVRP